MKSKIISGIVAASLALTAFVSLGITASAAEYDASTLAVGTILTGGTDSIKQDGGTTKVLWGTYPSLLKLYYNAADGTQVKYTETNDGQSTTVYSDSRYTYWKVASVTKENHDWSRDDYIVTVTANDPYVNVSATTNVWTGDSFPLVTVSSFLGTVQYSLDNETWSTTVPTASEVGIYTVYCKAIPGTQTNNVESEVSSVTSTILARGAVEGEVKASEVKVGSVFTGGVDKIYQDGGTSVIWHSLLKLTYKAVDGTQINYTETEDGQSKTVFRSDDARYVYWTVTSKSSEVIDYYGQFPRTDYIITLTARDPAVPTGQNLYYTGEPQALVSVPEEPNGTIYYSTDNEAWSTEIPTATDKGEYTVYYKVTGDERYNNIGATSVKTTIEEPKPATVGYANAGDYGEGSDRASAWNVIVIPGDIAIESINVKVNGKSSKEGVWEDSTVFSGMIQFGVAVNAAAEKVTSLTAVINGEDIVATRVD